MGSGKSTVGRALARRLGIGHVDTDDLVERATGRTIAEIFETDGEDRFRELERNALESALGAASVVSTGGGIVVTEANRSLLEDTPALVVWLDGSLDALTRRVGSGRNRPLLEGDIRSALREKMIEREPGYLAVADLRVDTTDMSHADCVDAIEAVVRGVSA